MITLWHLLLGICFCVGVVSSFAAARELGDATEAGELLSGGGLAATGNNGNVWRQTTSRGANTWTQNYGYDLVNRLVSAAETGAGTWSQNYGYDAAGNRWVCGHTGVGLAPLTLETPQNLGDCTSSSWFSPNNQVQTWGYDRGSVTSIGGMSRAFTYDEESRQVAATINGQTAPYSYDGEGRRVQSVSGGAAVVYVYDAGGQLVAEYGGAVDAGTQYVTVDGLGSTRLVTKEDTSGGAMAPAVYKESDYLPFGEELKADGGCGARG